MVNVCGTPSYVVQKRAIALLADRVINVILYEYKRLPRTHTLKRGHYQALLASFILEIRRSIIENLYSTNQLNCDFKFNETQDSRKGKLKLLLFKER